MILYICESCVWVMTWCRCKLCWRCIKDPYCLHFQGKVTIQWPLLILTIKGLFLCFLCRLLLTKWNGAGPTELQICIINWSTATGKKFTLKTQTIKIPKEMYHRTDNHWLLTAQVSVQFQGSLCGIYGGKSTLGLRFSCTNYPILQLLICHPTLLQWAHLKHGDNTTYIYVMT
jgi:hypothetical protein